MVSSEAGYPASILYSPRQHLEEPERGACPLGAEVLSRNIRRPVYF